MMKYKMKKYIATFWRGNPQLKNGGYETTKEIEATTMSSAKKKAREISEQTIYGTMVLRSIVRKEG